MRTRLKTALAAVVAAGCAAPALAADVTIDFNGFPNARGGQVNSRAYEKPMRFEPTAKKIVIEDAQPGMTYSVDLYHNGGKRSSDFVLVMNEAGDGVASAKGVDDEMELFDGFEAGDTSLKFRTFPVILNANNVQRKYFVSGVMNAHSLKGDEGPIKVSLIPGTYAVDNLYNTGHGNEDWHFLLDSDGNLHPAEGDEAYVEIEGNELHPRSAKVRLTLEASDRIRAIPTHEGEQQVSDDHVYTQTLTMTPGSGGVLISSFGEYSVASSNMLVARAQTAEEKKAGEKPEPVRFEGMTGENDVPFYPILKWSEDDGFYFLTRDGKADQVSADLTGFYDNNERPLRVKVKAEILEEKSSKQSAAPATQPSDE